ncbi:MAG: YigZ family protein [Halanaerobiales bacterium]
MKKNINIPAENIEIKNKVKDSIFYGNISIVKNKKEAKNFINTIKEKYDDATHNVSAYRIGEGDSALEYADDDGEPSGSSAPPVLQAIKGENLINTVIVVTRYFGGTKLGIGGLIRAYGDTARKAINKAGKKNLKTAYQIKIRGNYDDIGTIMGQIESFQGKIMDTSYNNQGVEIIAWIIPDKFDKFKSELKEQTSAKAILQFLEEKYILG